MLGCIAIADNLIPWYLGDSYAKAANLMKLLSPIILIIGFSNVFGLQFLIPTGQDKKFTIAIITGAVSNLCLNLVFIRFWQSYGAAIATLVAEFLVTMTMYFFIRKNVKLWKILFSSWKYILSGIIMFIPCYFVGVQLSPSILHTFLIVGMGAGIYGVLLLILRDEFLMMAFRKILRRGKK